MEEIKMYLDSVFTKYVDNERSRKAKADLLIMMEEKYENLISDGKTRNEAIGTVISEFGNVDELGLEEINNNIEDGSKIIKGYEMDKYLRVYDEDRNKFAFSIMMYILAPAVLVFLLALQYLNVLKFSEDKVALGGVVILFIIVAVASIIIYNISTKRENERNFHENEKIFLENSYRDKLINEIKTKESNNKNQTIFAMALCILSPATILIVNFILESKNVSENINDGYYLLAVTALLIMISISIFIFVKNSTDNLKHILKISSERYSIKEYKNEENIFGIYWLIVLIIYLTTSFLINRWDKTWLIWPIAGILSAIFKLVIQYFRE